MRSDDLFDLGPPDKQSARRSVIANNLSTLEKGFDIFLPVSREILVAEAQVYEIAVNPDHTPAQVDSLDDGRGILPHERNDHSMPDEIRLELIYCHRRLRVGLATRESR